MQQVGGAGGGMPQHSVWLMRPSSLISPIICLPGMGWDGDRPLSGGAQLLSICTPVITHHQFLTRLPPLGIHLSYDLTPMLYILHEILHTIMKLHDYPCTTT